MMRKSNKMTSSTRTGLALLIIGAIIVGLGRYYDKDAVSLYGIIMTVLGFSLYMISSFYSKRKNNNK